MAKRGLTNPHGANQYKLDPRQAMFLAYYIDPESQSRGNAYKSAILAGYEEEYALNITSAMPLWLSEKIGEYERSGLLAKAEKNIEKFLDMPTRVQAMGAFGPLFEKVRMKKKVKLKNGRTVLRNVIQKVPIMVEHVGLQTVQQKSSHFVAERLGRKSYGAKAEDAPVATSIVNIAQIIIEAPTK